MNKTKIKPSIRSLGAVYIENARNPLGFEKLRARCVIVTSQIEELRQDLRRESTNMQRRFLSRFRHPVSTNPTNFPFFVLVIVATNPTWVLSLPLPHHPTNQKIKNPLKIRRNWKPRNRGTDKDWLEWPKIEDLSDGCKKAGKDKERKRERGREWVFIDVGWLGKWIVGGVEVAINGENLKEILEDCGVLGWWVYVKVMMMMIIS